MFYFVDAFDIGFEERVDFDGPKFAVPPALPLHLVDLEPQDEVLNEALDREPQVLVVALIEELNLSYSHYNLVELKSTKGSIRIVNHVNQFNIGCDEKAVNHIHREVLVNDTPLCKHYCTLFPLPLRICCRNPSIGWSGSHSLRCLSKTGS